MTEKNPIFILAGNGPYDNRGCEAIVRGTVKILRHYYDNPSFVCISHFQNEEQFKKQSIEEEDKAIIHKKTNIYQKYTSEGIFRKVLRITNSKHYKYFIYKDMLPYLNNAKAILSVGGDNYSLDYGIPKLFTDLDDIALERGKNLAIWGASLGPFDKYPEYEKYIINHFKAVTSIFARESATIQYLDEKGVNANVYAIADPAFLMDPTEPKATNNKLKIDGSSIGINLSPLMSNYITNGNVHEWAKIAAEILSTISRRIPRKLYLIPQVTTLNSNDYIFMKDAMSMMENPTDNIVLVPPIYNASETKWIISKMDVFIGARTHATIAALSSYVPTLSLAYSIKAKGINKDIFGDELYCLDSKELNPKSILEKIDYMLNNSEIIKSTLRLKIPEIQQKSLLAGKYLQETTEVL